MCGIAGIISPHSQSAAWFIPRLTAMSAALRHRGPDGYGYLLASVDHPPVLRLNQELPDDLPYEATVGLAHRRLSIIDLSDASLQPMVDAGGEVALVFNGEIYNYLALHEELEALGYAFQTSGDTEVLLRAYQAWGEQCFARINGMWAVAIWDRRRECVVLARDRTGIKPLYYAVQHDHLYFASEIGALLAVPDLPCAPNDDTVARYLLTGLVDDTVETFYAGIRQFPAAHYAVVEQADASRIVPQPYWDFPTAPFAGIPADAVQQFRELFIDAVRLHAQSDVPVGTCLSGGLDSSAIVCVSELLRARQAIPRYSHTAFGYVSSEAAYCEKPFMDIVARATETTMHYIDISREDFLSRLPEILAAQDEPFGSASIAMQWFIFERARREGMTVMLDGQGADETLGGYHAFFVPYAATLLRQGKWQEYLAFRGESRRVYGKITVSEKALLQAFVPKILGRMLRSMHRSPNTQVADLLNHAFQPNPAARVTALSESDPYELDAVLRGAMRATVLPALLRYEDRNSMTHAIESRVPFLDYRLVDLLFSLPSTWKINGILTKYILREAMLGILPELIRTRTDKIGFRAAADLTFTLADDTDFTRNAGEMEARWFHPDGVADLMGRRDLPNADFLLWRIINTKLWLRRRWGSMGQ